MIVVRTVVGRARMRNFERDNGDVRRDQLRGDYRRNVFIGLELDRQVDALAYESLGVAQCGLRAVLVIDDDEIDIGARGSGGDAVADCARERKFAALRRVAELVAPPLRVADVQRVKTIAGPRYQSSPL